MIGATLVRRIAGAGVTAMAVVMLARASAAPWPSRGLDTPRLRLSWSARPERIEVCRRLSDQELAEREVHMRQRVECEGRFATYRLRVQVDTATLTERIVRGGGLRHDRPMHLLLDLDVPPGPHRLRVTLARVERVSGEADSSYAALGAARPEQSDTGLFAGRAQREASEHARRAMAAIPPRLDLDETAEFRRGRLLLVTFDSESRELRLVGR